VQHGQGEALSTPQYFAPQNVHLHVELAIPNRMMLLSLMALKTVILH
jgi:hypothetical protein